MFTHVVLFWLKPDAPANAKEQLLGDCRTLLSKIETLKTLDAGVPAMTPREVVDNSYTVGLLTVFADKSDHDTYQTHPLHLEFIAQQGELVRVQVYDFVA
ncbi:MAG: Dabb family protein [Tepidisphaeraceae bacterium]